MGWVEFSVLLREWLSLHPHHVFSQACISLLTFSHTLFFIILCSNLATACFLSLYLICNKQQPHETAVKGRQQRSRMYMLTKDHCSNNCVCIEFCIRLKLLCAFMALNAPWVNSESEVVYDLVGVSSWIPWQVSVIDVGRPVCSMLLSVTNVLRGACQPWVYKKQL